MPDPRLKSLFANPSFRADLPDIVRLPEAALARIVTDLASTASQSAPHSSAQVKRLASDVGISEDVAGGAFALSQFVANLFEEDAATPAEVHAEVVGVLGEAAVGVENYRAHLDALFSARADFAAARHRRSLVSAGGRTLHSFSAVSEFRVRTAPVDVTEEADISEYDPQLLELLPVVTIKISFASVDDGDDCVFQLTPGELELVIRELQVAQRVVAKGHSVVSLRGAE